MQSKWLSSWRGQGHSSEDMSDARKQIASEQSASVAPIAMPSADSSDRSFAAARMDFPAVDEIYRAAGIQGPRLGYTIEKIVEMLQSEHIKNLPAETKRASLLMALEAAGVQVDEVLHDAALRQHALTSHETTQRKRLEEYEARKAQENVAIQAEADRVAAEYAARISHNLGEVARARDGFRNWQAKKQQEAQRIVAATALCFSNSGAGAPAGTGKPASDRMAAFRELAAAYNDPEFLERGKQAS